MGIIWFLVVVGISVGCIFLWEDIKGFLAERKARKAVRKSGDAILQMAEKYRIKDPDLYDELRKIGEEMKNV